MGDTRFLHAYARVRDAADPRRVIRELADEEVMAALAATPPGGRDDYLVNVLATEAMNRARQKQVVLDHVGEGVVLLDERGTVLFANPAAERLLDRQREEMVGRDFHELVDHRHQHEGPVHRDACSILRASRGGESVRGDDHDLFVRADGSSFLAGFTAAPVAPEGVPTGAVVIFRDISERKAAERVLALSRAALTRAPDAIFWLARDGSVLYANEAAARHLGYSREELTSMRVTDFDVDFDRERWAETWRKIEGAGEASLESTHRTKSGEDVRVIITASYVRFEGEAFHVAFVRRA